MTEKPTEPTPAPPDAVGETGKSGGTPEPGTCVIASGGGNLSDKSGAEQADR